MMPSSPWTFARARSTSRYLAVRFSSDQTSRMRASLNMSPKMRESIIVEAMDASSFCGGSWEMGSVAGKGQGALGLQHDGSVDHATVEPGRAGRCSIGSDDALSPVECLRARTQCGVDRLHLARMNAKLGAEAEPSRNRE